MKGRTMTWLAGRTGFTLQGVSQILSGQKEPRLDSARRIAGALGVSLDRFARAWLETRRRREELEAARKATREALEAFGKNTRLT